MITASLELGTILRDLPERTVHPLIDVRRAYRFGYANQLWPQSWAVRAAFKANMEQAEAHGHGNRARRRASTLSLNSTQ